MKVFTELNFNPKLSLALGYFDGVHLGHQCVIKQSVEFAHLNNCKSAIITFKEHPVCYFRGCRPNYILTHEQRRQKIDALGVDYLYELDFSQFANLTAEDYLENVLVKNFSPISITTGFNHNFGKNKSGNTEFLEKMSNVFGYKYFLQAAEKLEGEVISSTAIRKYLLAGNIKQANKMLGNNFPIEGTVVKGQQLGRKIGFRTANLIYPDNIVQIPYGVYATNVFYNNNCYKGITNFGIRPTVSQANKPSLETNILEFDEDIYGENISIEFLEMLRPEQKFSSLDKLITQIKFDVEKRQNMD